MRLTFGFVIYIILVIVMFLGFKLWADRASTQQLSFLLKPVSWGLRLWSGTTFEYIDGQGYYFSRWNILVQKSCAAYHFMGLCFLTLAFTGIKQGLRKQRFWVYLCFSIGLAYFITIISNTMRIWLSVKPWLAFLSPKLELQYSGLWHEFLGLLIFSLTLFAVHWTSNYSFNYFKINEKMVRS